MQTLRLPRAGEIIRNDWEFHTLFGIEFATLENIVRMLPAIDDSEEDVALAINNSMNNLFGYPHGGQSKWHTFLSVSPSEVHRVLTKWRGHSVASSFEGIQ